MPIVNIIISELFFIIVGNGPGYAQARLGPLADLWAFGVGGGQQPGRDLFLLFSTGVQYKEIVEIL